MTSKICIAALIACVAAAGEVRAGNFCELERLRTQSQGEGVSAEFSSVDTSTCALGIETIVHVDGSQGVIRQADLCGRGGSHIREVTETQTNVVSVVVAVYDRCLDATVLSVTGTGEAEDLHVSQNFKTASLRAAFTGVDEFDEKVSIAIDLVWNGVGNKEHTGDHVSGNQHIVQFNYTTSGTLRDAVATGSVAINDTDYTPVPSTEGTIERDAARSLNVYR